MSGHLERSGLIFASTEMMKMMKTTTTKKRQTTKTNEGVVLMTTSGKDNNDNIRAVTAMTLAPAIREMITMKRIHIMTTMLIIVLASNQSMNESKCRKTNEIFEGTTQKLSTDGLPQMDGCLSNS